MENSVGPADVEGNHEGFEAEEDNNPFSQSHQGLASIMSDRNAEIPKMKGDNKHGGKSAAAGNLDDDDDDESMLLYAKNNKNSDLSDQLNDFHVEYESRVSKLLKPGNEVKVHITEASNSNEGMNNSLKKYVVYTIKLVNSKDPQDEIQTRRRYSDFESLRDVLTKIFPLIIVPPIPPKNYMNFPLLNNLVGSQAHVLNGSTNEDSTSGGGPNANSYSYINSTHLNKTKLVEHRKRLLCNFLNNCLKINQIRNLEFFAKFLDPNANWTDEIVLIVSQLPRTVFQLNPENGLKTNPIYVHLPNPSSGHTISFLKDNKNKLKQKTNKLLLSSSEDNTIGVNGVEAGAGTGAGAPATTSVSSPSPTYNDLMGYTADLDVINKKIMQNFIGLSTDYGDLGTSLNSFSLLLIDTSKVKGSNEELKLNIIFDEIGQIFDRSCISINSLLEEVETKFSEPLGEAAQYTPILQTIFKFKEKKLRQQGLLDSELKDKRKELDDLLKIEDEYARIDNALNSTVKDTKYDLNLAQGQPTSPSQTTNDNNSNPSTTSSKFRFPSMNTFKRITQYVSEIIDQNPEQTRKQRIELLKAKIETLEKCQKIMLEDINYITDEVTNNFSIFHKKQAQAIFNILLTYNKLLIGWAKKNMEIWEQVKEEILKL